MHTPVIVGVIVAIIFIVAFSEWFYHLVAGWREIVLDDVYFKVRIAGVTLMTMVVFGSTFYIMALVNECPKKNEEGPFVNLRCDEYLAIKASTEKIIPEKSDLSQ